MQEPIRNKKKTDFSDIDNLHRATESFLREQHKLLSSRKPVRAPRNVPFWNTKTKTAAISALSVVLALTGIAFAAGNRHSDDDAIIVPKQTETAQVAEQTAPPPSETELQLTEETVTAVLTSAAAKKPERHTTAVPGTEDEQSLAITDESVLSEAETDAEDSTAAQTGNPQPAQTHQPVIVHTDVQHAANVQPAVTNPPVHTTVQTYPVTQHLTVPTSSTGNTVTTQRTVLTVTTRRTTTVPPATTRRTTTAETTTTPKPTTVTTTTTVPPRPNLQLVTSYMGDWEHYDAQTQVKQKLTVLVRNAGTGALTEKKSFVFNLPCDVRHVSCVSENGDPQNLAYVGNKIYFTLDAAANPQDYVQIELKVLTDNPFFNYTVEFDP